MGLALLTYLLYPTLRGVDVPLLDVGEVAPEEVLAPFEFTVPKTAVEREREADALAATVKPIYAVNLDLVDSVANTAEFLFAQMDSASSPEGVIAVASQFGINLIAEEAEFLARAGVLERFRRSMDRLIRRYLPRGVASSSVMAAEINPEILLRRGDSERVIRRDSVLTLTKFLERRSEAHPAPNSALGDEIFVKLLSRIFRPTLLPRMGETEALREQLRASVDPVKDTVRADERIIAAHEVVTPEARDRLLALRQELVSRGVGEVNWTGIAGQILTNGMILAAFWLLLMLYRQKTYADWRQMLTVALLFAIVILGAAALVKFVHPGPELIPVPFAAMLITVLVSGRASIVAAVVLAVLLGSQNIYGGLDALHITLIGGIAASLSVRSIRRRSQLLQAFMIVAGGFVVASLTVALRMDWSLAELGSSLLRGLINAFASAALVTIALPVFEALARRTTDLTLLELSDPSHPLLKRLATEAPGTYAHSIAMANLCESACNAIGANGLMARVGCYFHDVGKLKRPQFFAENQLGGSNPHDKLKPDVSASIIRNHVKEGLALAEEHRLPKAVRDFIPEHHGTLEISYFLDRARSKSEEEKIQLEQFRYPGPPPRSVETAVAMLADGVEAAMRVLDDPTPEKLRDAIDHLAEQRIEAGQFKEAPLTLAELEAVKGEFTRILSGMHHSRIDYPTSTGGINAEWRQPQGA